MRKVQKIPVRCNYRTGIYSFKRFTTLIRQQFVTQKHLLY